MAERPPLDSFFKVKSPIQQEDLEPEVTPEKIFRKLKGVKGDKGERGIDGKDGKDGKDGRDGVDGKDGERGFVGEEGRPGKDGLSGKDGVGGKDGSPDTGKEIIEKVNRNKTAKIKASKIEGFDELKNDAESNRRNVQRYLSLGGQRQTIIQSNGKTIATGATTINFTNGTIAVPTGNDGSTINYTAPSTTGGVSSVVAGSGISVNNTDPANPVVSATGTTVTFYADTVSGTIDGSNTVFTVPNTITTALALWLANSIYQPGVDFTVTGAKQITMTVAPDVSLSGQPFWLSHI